MTYPPRPRNISIPAVVAGNILQNDDTSVSVIEDNFQGSILMKTDNTLAMMITPDQKVSINTQTDNSMLTINNDIEYTPTLRLSYLDSFYFDMRVTPNGELLCIPSCDDLSLNNNLTSSFLKNFDIADHDGIKTGLRLGGNLVTASASEINYVDVPVGAAKANKALVLDSSLTITGINRLDANQLSGTLLTGPQPNITSLNTVNIAGDLMIKGTVLDVSPVTLRYLIVNSEGVAYPSKAVILDYGRNFTGINNLAANSITGTLTAGPQPNITALSALTSLTNNGPSKLAGVTIQTAGNQLTIKYNDSAYSTVNTNIAGDMFLRSTSSKVVIDPTCHLHIPSHDGIDNGLYLGQDLVTATAAQLNYTDVTPGTASAVRALVLDVGGNITGIGSLSAYTLSGTIQTEYQPWISKVNTLNIANHNGTTGLSLSGKLVTASADQLNAVDVVAGSAGANKTLVLDSSKSISGIVLLSATSLAGVLTTPDQPNIKSVNTLTITSHNGATTGLKLGGVLVTSTADQLNRLNIPAGTAIAGKALVADGSCSIVGINNLTATNLSATIQTAAQPNINMVNTLNVSQHDGGNVGLSLNGTLITATASQINRVDVPAGAAQHNKALVLDTYFNISGINVLTATILGGLLSDPNQTNIRNMNSINILDHNCINTGLSLNGVLVLSSATQLNYLAVPQGTGTASKALVLDSMKNISNINSLTATSLNGTILTAAQPYITRVATLNIMNHDGATSGLSLNGILIRANADQINTLIATSGIASSGKALVIDDSKNIYGINILSANSVEGNLITAYQPNLKSVNTLNIVSVGGFYLSGYQVTATATQINRMDTTTGVAAAGKAMILDNSLNISGINSLSANFISGIINTASQPNISSVSTLNITNHDGSSKGLMLNNVLVTATANQLNYNSVVAGSAIALKALVTDLNNSISGINTLSASIVSAAQLNLTGVISNFNTGALVIKSYSSTDIIGRMVDIQLLQASTFSNFQPAAMKSGYSSEIIGYIKPQYSETYTFLVTCNDRVRLWVNGELVLHSWLGSTSTRFSSTIFLNAEQWVPIYIQYQVDANNTPFFLLQWSSISTAQGQIATSRMAWDSNTPAVSSKQFSQNALTIYNTSTITANAAKFSVDTSGDLIIDASGNDVSFGAADNVNIPSHNGTSQGLYLAGVLVQPTAYELNYLKVNPGIAIASHAMVVDSSKSITGVNSITASSVACNNLTANAFSINTLSLSGPLNNYNSGALLIRQITGPDVGGRIVHVDTITDINLLNYDPQQLGTNYSIDISGYILPKYTENYNFSAIADDRVRIWVANTLILNVWDTTSGTEYTSSPISLTAGQWVPIYIQYQNITGTASLQVRWSSTSLIKTFIDAQSMAWDNSISNPQRAVSTPNRLTIFSSVSGLTSVQTGNINIDGNGIMTLSSTSGVVGVATATNFNIIGHNGTNGLQLSGILVSSSATELNYLSGVNPGSVIASKAVVLDSNKALSGFSSLSSTNLIGTLQTTNQPNITSLGTLSSTLNSISDVVITSTNSLRLASDSTACYIQAGNGNVANAAADLFIGNYGASPSVSTRKFMVKASGFVGLQTSSPQRTLTINGAGSNYCLRLVNNSSDGSEVAYCDIGVDTSSNLRIGSNLIMGTNGTATFNVNSSGIMNITPSGGSIQIGNATNSIMPLEVGSTLFTLTSTSGYINSEGSVGSTVPTATSYSIRTSSSIIVNGTICVTSDRRLKQQIQSISVEDCKDFIMSSRPVHFRYANDPLKMLRCGLIAQDVAKTKFAELVKTSPHQGLDEEIDSEGFVSPKDAAFNVSYEEIIPILMTTMRETIAENTVLKDQLKSIESRMKQMEDAMFKILNQKIKNK